MSEGADIWQRYDAKVVQVRELEEKLAELEAKMLALADERDRWAKSCAVLTQKLTSVRLIAERLRNAERNAKGRQGIDPTTIRLREEYDRAREVIGCLISSLASSWSGREQVWRAQASAGGRLLYALTRGAMASVSMESQRVDVEWLRKLDLDRLRIELGFDDGGVEVSVDEGDELVEGELAGIYDEEEADLYGQGRDLPPPPSYTGAGSSEPPLISAYDHYGEPEPALAPSRPLPTRADPDATVVKKIPAPAFNIGKLVKPV
ncbi:MAG: hypothetical protein H6711_17675 [Myxococcales bacterium]|nr:hypothetical protein [Myxococcales bacterium]